MIPSPVELPVFFYHQPAAFNLKNLNNLDILYKQHTSPNIEKAYFNSSLDTYGARFFTMITASEMGANLIFNISSFMCSTI